MKFLRRSLVVLAAIVATHADAQTAGAAPRKPGDETLIPSSHKPASGTNAAVFKACASASKLGRACPLDAVFGLFKLAPNNAVLDFKVSNTVPRVINQNYGWVAKLNRTTGKVRVLERLTLPDAPASWGAGGQPYGLSADHKTISLDVTLTIYNGTVSKSWDVAEGDPPGHYLISAYIEDSAPLQFEFDVVAPR